MASFAFDLQKFGEKAELRMDLVVKRTAMDLLRGIVMDTPVKTGRARANWQVTIGGSRAFGTIAVAGSPGAAAGNAAITAGIATIASAEQPEGKGIYITNNLPYIRELEDGSSKQAPSGMVRKNIERFRYLVAENAQTVEGGAGI